VCAAVVPIAQVFAKTGVQNMTTGSFSTNRAVDVAFFVKVPLDAHPDDYYHAVEYVCGERSCCA
jgi:hypothetical protein